MEGKSKEEAEALFEEQKKQNKALITEQKEEFQQLDFLNRESRNKLKETQDSIRQEKAVRDQTQSQLALDIAKQQATSHRFGGDQQEYEESPFRLLRVANLWL